MLGAKLAAVQQEPGEEAQPEAHAEEHGEGGHMAVPASSLVHMLDKLGLHNIALVAEAEVEAYHRMECPSNVPA